MNFIDLFIILLLAFGVIKAIHKGFLNTFFGCIAVILAILLSLITYPILSSILNSQKNVSNALMLYVEGSNRLDSVESQHLDIETTEDSELMSVIDEASFPAPYSNIIKNNIHYRVFSKNEIYTLGEYVDKTLACALLNTVCFLLLFFIYYLAMRFIINIMDHRKGFYVLKKHEALFAGAAGALLYSLLLSVFFLLVSVGLVTANVSQLTQYVSSSLLGSLYYKVNAFVFLISGTI
ncbi:MAG: hypothetical protein R2876_07065 [Eubacteriales bacterium]